MALVLIFVLAYLRFLAALPARTRNLFLLAGAIYVAGALGVEMIGGRHAFVFGRYNFAYTMIATLEEFLEMLGILLFVQALLSYMQVHVKEVQFRIDP